MQKTMKIVLSSLAVLAFAGLLLFFGGDMCADDSYADPVGGDCSAAGDGSVTWSYENYILTISGNGAMKDYTMAFPASEVEGAQPWAFNSRYGYHTSAPYDFNRCTQIVIGAGVTHIGAHAFDGGNNVSSSMSAPVRFEGNLADITFGSYAFSINSNDYGRVVEAPDLSKDNLRKVSEDAFFWSYDAETKKLTLMGGGDTVLRPSSWTSSWFSQEVKRLDIQGIKSLSSNSDIYFENDIEALSGFRTLLALERPQIYAGFESIVIDGKETMAVGNNGIKYVEDSNEYEVLFYIPSDITSISSEDLIEGTGVFCPWAADGLTRLSIPDGLYAVVLMGGRLDNLTYLKIEGNPEVLITTSNVNVSSRNNFSILSNLTTLDLSGSKIDSIYNTPNKLESVMLPQTFKNIGAGSFQGKTMLTTIDLSSVETIGNDAFNGCSKLNNVRLNNIKTIGDQAFYGCSNLSDITIGDGCETIGSFAFLNTAIKVFTMPKKVTVSSNILLLDKQLEAVVLPEGYEGNNVVINGFLLDESGKKLLIAPAIGGISCIVPSGVETIGARSISSKSFDNLIIPSTVTSMEGYAILNSSFKIIYFEEFNCYSATNSCIYNTTYDKAYWGGWENPGWYISAMEEKAERIQGAFTVSFNTFGGTPVNSFSYSTYLDRDVELPVPVKGAQIFAGWYADSALTQPFGYDRIPYGYVGNLTLYAAWATADKMVLGADVIGFSGATAIIAINSSFMPAGNVIVTYSEYVDLAEGAVLFPFLTGVVDVDEGTGVTSFTAPSGKAIESCSVTFRYTLVDMVIYTPLSYAVAPATSSALDLTADSGITVSFDGNPVTNGAVIEFGLYEVSVAGEQTVTINGIVWTNGNKMFYGGQKLVVSKAA